MTLDEFVKFCEKEYSNNELAAEKLRAEEHGMSLEEYRRCCALCGEPTTEKHPHTGETVHLQCADGYDQNLGERQAELEYRARTGNDPRARLARYGL